MRVVTTSNELAQFAGGVLVPTMGALHTGHAQLVREAARHRSGAGPIVVSVFVNPTQFNDPRDLERYPRTLDADVARCGEAGADVVFAPPAEVMYPPGVDVRVPALPRVAVMPGLEDRLRPGHFAGVCQVVGRLFELVKPRVAMFGEKDWQQFQVIRAMTHEAGRSMTGEPIEIVGVPTVRDDDGLALSSRNIFLSASDRRSALAIPRALAAARGMVSVAAAEAVMDRELLAAGLEVQYATIRRAETLEPLSDGERRGDRGSVACRALIAAKVPGPSGVRLIDNAEWGR
jgi:pantoate--beta-alanine ligase